MTENRHQEEAPMRKELWLLDRNGKPSRKLAAGELIMGRCAQVEVDDEGQPVRIVKVF